MKNNRYKWRKFKRLLSAVLALTIMVTLIPMDSMNVYANEVLKCGQRLEKKSSSDFMFNWSSDNDNVAKGYTDSSGSTRKAGIEGVNAGTTTVRIISTSQRNNGTSTTSYTVTVEHNYGAWTNYNDAAKHKRTCSGNSNHIDYQNHSWNASTGKCSDCGYECLHSGQAGSTCTVCGKTLHTCSVGALQSGQAATCTTDGWNDYYICSCGKVYGTFYLDVANNIIYIYSRYFSDYMIASAAGYTVSFDAQGGTEVDAVIVPNGSTVASMPATSKTGYTFGGWYTDAACTSEFTSSTTVIANMTVYAKWTANGGGNSPQVEEKSYETVPLTYSVVKGDTMNKIARKYGLTLAELEALNPQIKNINLIYPGQIINVGSEKREVLKAVATTTKSTAEITKVTRNETDYIVKKGDCMIKIARKYNMTLGELASLNGWIKNLHWIYPGEKMKIYE